MSDQKATENQLRAKASGLYTGLNALPDACLMRMPTVEFAADYNVLRAAMAFSFPHHGPFLTPAVDTKGKPPPNYDPTLAFKTTYGELLAYVSQISNLLLEEDDPKDAGRQ